MVVFYPQFEDVLRNGLRGILGQNVERRIVFLNADDPEPIGGKALH